MQTAKATTRRERWRAEWKLSGPLILYPGIVLALVLLNQPLLAIFWAIRIRDEINW